MFESAQEPGLRAMIRRRWRAMALTAAVVLVGGAAYLSSLPTRYEASAKLLVMRLDQRLGGLKATTEAVPALTTSSRPLFTQAELLRSAPILQDVIARLSLKDKDGIRLPVDELAKRVQVVPIADTDVIKVIVQGRSAVEAKQIVTALCDAYQKKVADFRREGIRAGLKLIDEQIEAAQVRLRRAEESLLAFKRGSGSVNLPEQVRTAVTDLAFLDRDIRTWRANYERARARSASLRSKLGMGTTEALTSLAVDQNPRITALKSQLLAAETSPVLTQGLAPDHPERQAVERQIQKLRSTLASEVRATVGQAAQGRPIDEVRRGVLRSLVDAESEEKSALAGLVSSEAQRASLQGSINRFPNLELGAARLTRETEAASEVYRDLLRKREEARVSLAIAPSYAQVIEPGSVPKRPEAPLKGQAVPALLLAALAAAFGAGTLREVLDRSIRPGDLALRLPDLRILATVPTLSRWELRHGELVAALGGAPHYIEALRGLCVALEDEVPGQLGRVVAITSATPNEGKSVTAANLALCLAEAGHRVLIVDGDRRRPRLHELFGTGRQSWGFGDLLHANVAPDDAITHTGPVDVITAGKTRSTGRIAKHRSRLESIFEAWRQQYDFILLDLPPIAMFAEVADLSRHADGVMLVAAVGRISTELLEAAVRQVRTIKTPVLGMVAITRMGGEYGPHKRYLAAVEVAIATAPPAQTKALSAPAALLVDSGAEPGSEGK